MVEQVATAVDEADLWRNAIRLQPPVRSWLRSERVLIGGEVVGVDEGSIGAPSQGRSQQAVLVTNAIDGMTGDELFRRLGRLERRLRWKLSPRVEEHSVEL